MEMNIKEIIIDIGLIALLVIARVALFRLVLSSNLPNKVKANALKPFGE